MEFTVVTHYRKFTLTLTKMFSWVNVVFKTKYWNIKVMIGKLAFTKCQHKCFRRDAEGVAGIVNGNVCEIQ